MTDWRKVYWKWHVEIGLFVVFVGVVGVAVGLVSTRSDVARQAKEGQQAHVALCAQRDALRGAVVQNRLYLKLTPAQRVTRLGIPPALADVAAPLILQSIASEARTLRSYRALRC